MDKRTQPSPGPWSVVGGAVYDSRGHRILCADRDNQNTWPTERDANVRFASYAPEMAELLRAMLPHLREVIYQLRKQADSGNDSMRFQADEVAALASQAETLIPPSLRAPKN